MRFSVPNVLRAGFFLALGVLLTPTVLSQGPPSPTTLTQLRDRFRPLLLFCSRPDDPSLLAQMTRLKDSAPGLQERDILVITIPYKDPSPSAVSLSAADAAAARRTFHVAPEDFTAILLGKDGGEKLRSRKPVSFEKLRDKIDSMPMRKDEMKNTTGR